eukprot:TRINITY_DN37226_c0_g1_i1.p2 TRINITY_DN37226_c0_g1~~TRINITY_DN37226_c0_g1_i1.p2  ORF type:complete len:191 (+),score=38.16 TRINITY_DN37226_c0_g1_i1:38-610(+)
MKDLINKGKSGDESTPDAEVAAFRALVSNYFDNFQSIGDTDSGKASAPDAAANVLEIPGRTGVRVEDVSHSYRAGSPGSNIHLSPHEVEVLATRALGVLAESSETNRPETPLAQLFALTEAYVSFDEAERHEILARIMRRGVSAIEVIDDVVPATARYKKINKKRKQKKIIKKKKKKKKKNKKKERNGKE